jgi:hypothetical protein
MAKGKFKRKLLRIAPSPTSTRRGKAKLTMAQRASGVRAGARYQDNVIKNRLDKPTIGGSGGGLGRAKPIKSTVENMGDQAPTGLRRGTKL